MSRAFQVISRPPQVISSRQVISSGLRISRALRIFRRGRRDKSGVEMARSFRMTRSAQDDSVRCETSHVLRHSCRHCKVFSSGLRISLALRMSRGGRRDNISSDQDISRGASGQYLERSGYLEGGVGTTRASRWIGPFSFRITRSARLRMTVDSVRYTTYKASHVPRHCKWGPVCYFYFAFGGLTFRGLSPPI